MTIGVGLVAQLPAFLVALAAGLIVTRTSVDCDLPQETVTQIFQHSRVLYITAVALSVLAFTGLPLLPMMTFAMGCACLGWLIDENPVSSRTAHNSSVSTPNRPLPHTTVQVSTSPAQAATISASDPKDQLHVEPLQLYLGFGLVRLADSEVVGDLLGRGNPLRMLTAEQWGFNLRKG